jgi:hypothetical protein
VELLCGLETKVSAVDVSLQCEGELSVVEVGALYLVVLLFQAGDLASLGLLAIRKPLEHHFNGESLPVIDLEGLGVKKELGSVDSGLPSHRFANLSLVGLCLYHLNTAF